MDRVQRKFPFIFLLLFGYVLLQFLWWGYMLYGLNKEVVLLEEALIETTSIDLLDKAARFQLQEQKLTKKVWMIFGEGAVFLVILIFGVRRVVKAYQHEVGLNRQQHNFLLSVTHELKSPIASIKLYMQTLLKHDLERQKQQPIFSKVEADADRLHKLVDNILLATQIENQNISINPVATNAAEALQDIIYNSNFYREQPARIEIAHLQVTSILADKEAMASIVLNLIENGLKYSPADVPVSVTTRVEDGFYIIAVSDKGAGIPQAEQSKVFQKFYRVGDEQTRSSKGTGLGLFIANTLAMKHGFPIKLNSEVGVGSTFEVTFKCA